MRLIFFASVLFILVCLGCTFPTQKLNIEERFQCEENKVPGYSILVTKGEQIKLSLSCGLENLETQKPISSKTIFNAGSLSKQFIAFGIFLLKEEGKLDFEESIHTILPKVQLDDNKVMIKHLLTHTSGIPDQWDLLTLKGIGVEDSISNDMVLELIYNQKQLNFEPGTKFQYSHSNYTLLAKIIEAKSNQSINTFLKENIFKPLGMDDSYSGTDSTMNTNNRVTSYQKSGKEWSKVDLNYFNYGPTNLMTNVEDLLKWSNALMRKNTFPPKLIDEFNEVSTTPDGERLVAVDLGDEKILGCSGQFLRDYKGKQFYSHGGSIGGFRGLVGRVPEDSISIVILGNDDSTESYNEALQILDMLSGRSIEEFQKNVRVERSNTRINQKLVNQLGQSSTFYNASRDLQFTLFHQDGKLYIKFENGEEHVLIQTEKNTFKVELWSTITFDFGLIEDDGDLSILVKTHGVPNLIFERLTPIKNLKKTNLYNGK